MTSLKLRMSVAAVQDLEQIWIFTKQNWSERQADRYYKLITDEISYLCLHPSSGRSYETVRKGCRGAKVKSHLIFYQFDTNVIEIIRILHERMEINEQL